MMATQSQHGEQEPEDFHGVTYEELSHEEWRAMFDRNAREWLGMSGEEFIQKWEAGETDDLNHTDVVMLTLMSPHILGSGPAKEAIMATQPQYEEHEEEDFYGVTYEELTREEGRALFDQRAREWLGMSGEEFIRKLEAGEIEDPDRTDVIALAIMIPFAR